MANKPNIPKPEEKLFRSSKTKDIYHYIDAHNDIDVKCREVYKDAKKVIHYPFKRNGSPKYNKVLAIEYHDMPASLPRGFRKSWKSGYGFTRELNPLLYALEERIDILRVIITKNESTRLQGKTLILNADDLDKAYPQLSGLLEKQRNETDVLVADLLAAIFPNNFKRLSGSYAKGELQRFIKQRITDHNLLSQEDISELLSLVQQLSEGRQLIDQKKVLITKEKIDKYFIEEVIQKFEKLLMQKTDTRKLEEKWHTFFKKYSWIFSQLFSYPVILFEDKAYVGGKGLDNKGGKVVDFLYKNFLSGNISIIELKTHLTELLQGRRAYRGTDVFPVSRELTGAINQVLDQRDNLQKEYYELSKKTDKHFETFNSKCIIVAGQTKIMTTEERKSFELFRSNSRDVDIVTFDELLERLKSLARLMNAG